MRIIDMYAKDVTVVFEIELSEIKKLQEAFNLTQIDYDSTKENEREAVFFLTKRFYPLIDELVKKAAEKADGA